LTALATEVAAVIALRGRPGCEQDLDALTHAVGRLWHRLPVGADRSETHWHGHLEAITQMLGIAIDAAAEESGIASALGTPAHAKVLRALAAAPAGLTNQQLMAACDLAEETVSRALKVLRGLGLVISMKLGRHSHSSLTGNGVWAFEKLLKRTRDQPAAAIAVLERQAGYTFRGPADTVQGQVISLGRTLPAAA
jgi:DNA-binding transcriptional ArsR family regulator